MMALAGQHYKVRLASGRVLGPLDLERVRLLIKKKQILGTEIAREYPKGDWKDINHIPEIAEIFISEASTRISESAIKLGTAANESPPSLAQTFILPEGADVPSEEQSETCESVAASPSPFYGDPEKTIVQGEDRNSRAGAQGYVIDQDSGDEPTRIAAPEHEIPVSLVETEQSSVSKPISREETVVFERTTTGKEKKRFFRLGNKEILKTLAAGVLLGLAGYQILLSEDEAPQPHKFEPIKPRLPSYTQGKSDPTASIKAYAEAMRFYVADNVLAYKKSVDHLQKAASLDATNVKALAMLASAYLNLIDSSNKDETYFSVISKLIDMSRAKAVDLPETVIADVEFFVTVNKPEAAQNRLIEYTKTHQPFDMEMFYYLAMAFFHRGDFQNAAKYIGNYPDNKASSARIFYLKAQIAEKLNDLEAALREYEKAVNFNPDHAKSRLRMAALLNKKGNLREASGHLEALVAKPKLLPPRDLAQAYYFHALLSEIRQKWDVALADMERAAKLDRQNHDYLLELYTLRAKSGESNMAAQREAKMYYFLGEGERQLRSGKTQEALAQFLQARQANDRSPTPLIKIGDMFRNLNDLGNARLNYKLATDRAQNDIDVWSKYIDVLIQSYEWDEAKKAMDRFRNLRVPQSAIDKAAADMYAKQARYAEAQLYYRKAMSRDTIDPTVYVAYAKSLMAVKNYKDAPFFFSLALRFDPLSVDSLVGIAHCIAEVESIDRGISMLQDELQKGSIAKAELLAAMAELQIQKGSWDEAQANIEQAMVANPDYAYPWKLQAQVYMNKEGVERGVLERSLLAYQSYIDRNPSDPTGYLERYRIFVKKTEYEKASEELSKVYAIYPKYPNLHFFKGSLYALMGNHKAAVEEFRAELANNESNVTTLLSLGKEYVELGNVPEALKLFNKAMQIAPKSADAKHQSAYANYLLKNYQGAIALYQSALFYDKANPLIYKRLGIAYRDMGDPGNAGRAFRKYLEMEPDAPDRAEFERYR